MKLNDQQILGEMYHNQVLVNEAGWKGALAGAAMAASSLIPGQAKADDASPMLKHAQATTAQAQASTSILNNQNALRTLANSVRQNKDIINTSNFIKLLAKTYNTEDPIDLYNAVSKDLDAWDKKDEVPNKDEDLLMSYLSHHQKHLGYYIANVFPDNLRHLPIPR